MEELGNTLIPVLRKDECSEKLTSRSTKVFTCLISLWSSVMFQTNSPATGSSHQSPRIIQARLPLSSSKECIFNIVSQTLNTYEIKIKVKLKKKNQNQNTFHDDSEHVCATGFSESLLSGKKKKKNWCLYDTEEESLVSLVYLQLLPWQL